MQLNDEIYLLGKILGLLSKRDSLTLAEIRHNLRVFLKRKHQSDTNLFETLQRFCNNGQLRQIVKNGHIKFELQRSAFEPNALVSAAKAKYKADMVEQGIEDMDEFENPLTKLARQLAAKPIGQRGQE